MTALVKFAAAAATTVAVGGLVAWGLRAATKTANKKIDELKAREADVLAAHKKCVESGCDEADYQAYVAALDAFSRYLDGIFA